MTDPPETTLPPLFVQRMRLLLGAEADAFFAAYAHAEHKGLRVNLLKLDAERFRRLAPWPLEPVPWRPSGFYLPGDGRPGKHPYHAAGLFYLQEPSAMAVAEALDVHPGQRVLDLAAAPGGKATHIAALLEDRGLLVANEIEGGRVKPLAENLERWGARNVVIANATPERLAAVWGPIFDRVLLDAPCSGEGMFRRGAAARLEWSAEHVAGCALRQAAILDQAARLVRPGGCLLYSTCTFAPEENERPIAAFLLAHPGWELVDLPKQHGSAAAQPEWAGAGNQAELGRAIRLWPHRGAGEGHFIALLENAASDDAAAAPDDLPLPAPNPRRYGARDHRGRTPAPARPRASLEAWAAFESRSLTLRLPAGQIVSRNDHLYLLPADLPQMDGLRIIRAGLWLGTLKPGRFEPAHALALALKTRDARMPVPLDSVEVERYLRGETFPSTGPDGWALVTVAGWPLGWGRRIGGVVKNFYPKGLRRLG